MKLHFDNDLLVAEIPTGKEINLGDGRKIPDYTLVTILLREKLSDGQEIYKLGPDQAIFGPRILPTGEPSKGPHIPLSFNGIDINASPSNAVIKAVTLRDQVIHILSILRNA